MTQENEKGNTKRKNLTIYYQTTIILIWQIKRVWNEKHIVHIAGEMFQSLMQSISVSLPKEQLLEENVRCVVQS